MCIQIVAESDKPTITNVNTPYEDLNLANQNSRKSGQFSQILEGFTSLIYCYCDKY